MNISPVSYNNYNKTSFKSLCDTSKNQNGDVMSANEDLILTNHLLNYGKPQGVAVYNINIKNSAIKEGSKCKTPFYLSQDREKCYLHENGKLVPANVAIHTKYPYYEEIETFVDGIKYVTCQTIKNEDKIEFKKMFYA